MTLSFDIEAVGQEIDDEMRAAVVRGLDDEKAAEALDRLALSPFTGRAVVIACWDDHAGKGVCLTNDGLAAAELPAGFVLKPHSDERAMLQSFWSICSRQRRFATFNGNGYDVPFLVGRSLALDVTIHRPLLETKPWEDTHVDLRAKLSPGWGNGRSTLDVVCRGLGVPTPKGGIDGSQVSAAWRDGRRDVVAAYCCRDVVALAECLVKWDRCALGRREPAPAAEGVL